MSQKLDFVRQVIARSANKPIISLRGQVVLITGSSRGLGLALAQKFAAEGCKLVITARDEPELERARADLTQRGAEVLAVPCDITDRLQVAYVVKETLARFGQLDILVNNAGIIQVGPFSTMTLGDFENAMNIDFWGTLYAVFAVLPHMRERGQGRIVNITSIGGKISVPHLLPYSCAKFAATGLSEGLRAELAQEGINVITIIPGLMRTGSYLNAFFKGQRDKEFTWFSLGDNLPLSSIDVERAARQIVEATKQNKAELIITVQARLAAYFHGLFPGATANLAALANRLILPPPSKTGLANRRGMTVEQKINSPLLNVLTKLGQQAAARFNQYPGPVTSKGKGD